MQNKTRTLLILPCTSIKPYSKSPTWRFILSHIKPWMNQVDLVAVDCIINPETGTPFGIVPMSEENKVVGLDEKPDPKKLESLVTSVRDGLQRIKNGHRAVAYVNVRTYWQALNTVADEFEICMLPSVYRNASSWSVEAIGASPQGVFRKYVDELLAELSASDS